MVRKIFPFIMLLALAILACSTTATPPVIPTIGVGVPTAAVPTANPTATATPLAPTETLPPTATATSVPTATTAPAPTSAVAPVYVPASNNYIDDRSTPSQVIVSLYNAIKRREYLRAYNYWNNPATTLGNFNAYAAGYQNTASVDLVFGQITGDPGMSQIYYTVPVILKATDTNNVHTNFAACYVVHEVNPGVYGAPPVSPMGIDKGSAKVSGLNASDASVLASACSGQPTGPNPVSVGGTSLNIDKSNFIDNRSGPIETVSSLLNALNRQEYARAYSYFQDPATFPGPYNPFAAGYANTASITVKFGTVQSEGAAGSLYYKLPLAEYVLTTSNAAQTFVGCYTLRLIQPAVQGTPPFIPLGIVSGKFTQVANNANVNSLLPTACN